MISEELLRLLENATLKRISLSLGAKRQPGAYELAERLAPSVHNLWQLFNAKRPKKLPMYMNDKAYSQAYLASLFIPNVVKVAGLLESPALASNLNQSLAAGHATFTLIDYGAGPLTATLAFALVLPQFREKRITLKVLAVESSESIFNEGLEILAAVQEKLTESKITVEVTRIRLGDIEKKKIRAQYFIAANTLNELTPGSRKDLQKFLQTRVAEGMTALLIEPGQDVHSKGLSGFRDKILEENQNSIDILAPCTHRLKCPLGPSSSKSDWCWFRTPWKRSKWMETIDNKPGLSHDELNFSYVSLVGKLTKPTKGKANWGRIVSDRISLPEQPLSSRRKLLVFLKTNNRGKVLPEDDVFLKGRLTKTLVCASDSKLLGMYDKHEGNYDSKARLKVTTKSQEPWSPLPERGDLLESQPLMTWVGTERTEPTARDATRRSATQKETSRQGSKSKNQGSKQIAGSEFAPVRKKIDSSTQKTRSKSNPKRNVTHKKPRNRP